MKKMIQNYLSINKKFYTNLKELFNFIEKDELINGCEITVNDCHDSAEISNVERVIDFLKNNNRNFQIHGADIENTTISWLEYYEKLAQKYQKEIIITLHPAQSMKEDIKLFSRVMDEIKQRNFDYKLLIENLNLHRFPLTDITILLNQFEDLYWCLDVGHAIYDNEYIELSSNMKSKIKNVHIHDVAETYDHVPFYQDGRVNYIDAMNLLSNLEYDKAVVSEIALDYLEGTTYNEKLEDYKKNIKKLCYKEKFWGTLPLKQNILKKVV